MTSLILQYSDLTNIGVPWALSVTSEEVVDDLVTETISQKCEGNVCFNVELGDTEEDVFIEIDVSVECVFGKVKTVGFVFNASGTDVFVISQVVIRL